MRLGQRVREIARERVDLGASAIIRNGKEQKLREVNLRKLSMVSGSRCVLGQVYGGFAHGLHQLNVDNSACKLGFLADSEVEAYMLNRAWRRKIRHLRRTHRRGRE